MSLYLKLRGIYLSYYLLAVAASIIIISVVGSINVMIINMGGNDGKAILEMALVRAASMGFLFTVLAQIKPVYVFNFFIWGMLFQIIFLVLKIFIEFKKKSCFMKKEIKNRADVFFLVDNFYTKVGTNSILEPIFNDAIDDWQDHLEHLTNFWESILFFKKIQ